MLEDHCMILEVSLLECKPSDSDPKLKPKHRPDSVKP